MLKHNADIARRLALIIAVVVGIAGCGIAFFGSLEAPIGVSATTLRTDLIELTWTEVAGADVYYVYRSLSEDGPFRPDGPLLSLPYRTVRQTTLLDVEVDPTSYYYAVSAGRLSTGVESDTSLVVRGEFRRSRHHTVGHGPHDTDRSDLCADCRERNRRQRDNPAG